MTLRFVLLSLVAALAACSVNSSSALVEADEDSVESALRRRGGHAGGGSVTDYVMNLPASADPISLQAQLFRLLVAMPNAHYVVPGEGLLPTVDHETDGATKAVRIAYAAGRISARLACATDGATYWCSFYRLSDRGNHRILSTTDGFKAMIASAPLQVPGNLWTSPDVGIADDTQWLGCSVEGHCAYTGPAAVAYVGIQEMPWSVVAAVP